MKRTFLFVAHDKSPYISIYDKKLKLKMALPWEVGSEVFKGNQYAVSVSPNGELLATNGEGGGKPAMRVFNTTDWTEITIYGAPTISGLDVQFSPDSSLLCSLQYSPPYLQVFNTVDWSKQTLAGGVTPGAAYGCSFSPDGATLAVAHDGYPYLTLYNTSNFSKIVTGITGISGYAYCCKYSPDGSLLAIGYSKSPYLLVYRTSDWSLVTLSGGNPTSMVMRMSFSPDGSKLAMTIENSPYMVVYNTSDWSKYTISGGNPPGRGQGCSFSDDGSILAIGSTSSPFLHFYNTSNWSRSAPEQVPAGNGTCCMFSPPIGGTISNEDTTPITDALNVPVQRRVLALDRATLAILGQVVSGADGRYELPMLAAARPLTVLFQANSDMENSVVVDWVQPE